MWSKIIRRRRSSNRSICIRLLFCWAQHRFLSGLNYIRIICTLPITKWMMNCRISIIIWLFSIEVSSWSSNIRNLFHIWKLSMSCCRSLGSKKRKNWSLRTIRKGSKISNSSAKSVWFFVIIYWIGIYSCWLSFSSWTLAFCREL